MRYQKRFDLFPSMPCQTPTSFLPFFCQLPVWKSWSYGLEADREASAGLKKVCGFADTSAERGKGLKPTHRFPEFVVHERTQILLEFLHSSLNRVPLVSRVRGVPSPGLRVMT